jgi:hypothetical protein
MDAADLAHRFKHHPPLDHRTIETYQLVRDAANALAALINAAVPAGREQSTAFTHVENAMMWANAGIARNGGPTAGFNPDTYGTG